MSSAHVDFGVARAVGAENSEEVLDVDPAIALGDVGAWFVLSGAASEQQRDRDSLEHLVQVLCAGRGQFPSTCMCSLLRLLLPVWPTTSRL